MGTFEIEEEEGKLKVRKRQHTSPSFFEAEPSRRQGHRNEVEIHIVRRAFKFTITVSQTKTKIHVQLTTSVSASIFENQHHPQSVSWTFRECIWGQITVKMKQVVDSLKKKNRRKI